MAWLHSERRRNPATARTEDYWAIGFRDNNGKMCTEGLGFMPKREANRRFAIRQAELLKDGARRALPTLKEYLDTDFLPYRQRECSPHTYTGDQFRARVVCREMGDLKLDQVDYSVVDRYIRDRLHLGRAPTTVWSELTLVRGALQRAAKMGVLRTVPELPRAPKLGSHIKVRKFLTADETGRLLAAMAEYKGTENGWAYVCVLLAVNTGMRRGEILSRTWDDVNWAARTLYVGAKASIGFQVKTRRDRVIPIVEVLEKELQDYHRGLGSPPTGWIFPADRDPSKPRFDFRFLLRKGCREAGVQVVNPHALRRTWASHLAVNNADRASVLRLGGWTTGKMLDEVYAQVTPEHVASVMRRHGIGPTRRGR